jgi:hypothetical protein
MKYEVEQEKAQLPPQVTRKSTILYWKKRKKKVFSKLCRS